MKTCIAQLVRLTWNVYNSSNLIEMETMTTIINYLVFFIGFYVLCISIMSVLCSVLILMYIFVYILPYTCIFWLNWWLAALHLNVVHYQASEYELYLSSKILLPWKRRGKRPLISLHMTSEYAKNSIFPLLNTKFDLFLACIENCFSQP